MQDSFDTHHDSDSTTNLAQFLSTIPKPSIILMVVYYQAHDYYTGDPLRSLCPNALSSYTSRKSWSMICFYGFGTVPWVTSHTSTGDHGPAVVSIHILLPKGKLWMNISHWKSLLSHQNCRHWWTNNRGRLLESCLTVDKSEMENKIIYLLNFEQLN